MGARHRSRNARSRTSGTRPRRGVHRGLRARPAWARPGLRRMVCRLVAVVLGVLLLPAIALSATSAQIFPSFAGGKPIAHAASAPKSQLECEQKYGLGTGWRRCFSEPPGSSCNHPLELQKAVSTNRGDDRDLHASVSLEAQGEEGIQSWSWKTARSVAPCPHGVILKVARFSQSEHCGRVHGEEVCSHEYDAKTIDEPSTTHHGSFEYTIRPGWTDYLIVRGYYTHPLR
jgi:hypothetical protein